MISKKVLKITSLVTLLTTATIFSFVQPTFAKEVQPKFSPMVLQDDFCATKDLETGTETSNIVLKKVNSGQALQSEEFLKKDKLNKLLKSPIESKVVVGTDDKKLVENTTSYPYNAICYIESTFSNGDIMGATAWLAGDSVAVTAGHCVYDDTHGRGGWAKNVTVWPGRNGSSTPYGSTTSKRLTVNTNWKKSRDYAYDYGIIKLNSNISAKCDSLSWNDTDRYLDQNYELYITGYPDPNKYHQKMYEARGYAESYDSDTITYNIDTEPGDSGAPIMAKKQGNHFAVTGINSHNDGEKNYGVRVTETMSDTIDQVEKQN